MGALRSIVILGLAWTPGSAAAQIETATPVEVPLWVGPLPAAATSRPVWLLVLAVLLLSAAGLLVLTQRSRRRLPAGSASDIAGYMQRGLRLVSWSLLVTVVVSIAWPWLSWSVAGVVLLLVLLVSLPIWPDLVAGVVLRGARGVRTGVRLESGSVGGRVLRPGWLGTSLADEAGGRHSVPNRWLLQQPLRVLDADSPATSLVVEVGGLPVGEARRTIVDAVLSSPWVPAGAEVRVDHLEGARYRVRTEVLSAAYQGQLGSDLSERIERMRG